jgi:hypothetical protein
MKSTRVDVQAGDAQRVVVIPEVPRWDVVVVAELVRKPAGYLGPLRPHDPIARAVEELGVAVELEVAVPTVQVGHDRHTGVLD